MKFATRLRRMALWEKFTGLGLLCLAVMALPLALYWHQAHKTVAFAGNERQALPQAHLVLNIIQRTQQHRALSARYLEGVNIPKQERQLKAEELEAAIFTYEVYFDKYSNKAQRDEFAKVIAGWEVLQRQVSQKKVTPKESFNLHVALVAEQLQYLQTVVDFHQLSLDPDAESYFLIEAGLMQLPELTEILGQIRGLGVGLLTKGHASLEERAHLNALVLMSQTKMNNLNASVDKADMARKPNRKAIANSYQAIKTQYQKIVDLTQYEILSQEKLSFPSENFYAAFTLGLNSYFAYAHSAIDHLDNILAERITVVKNTLLVQIAVILLFALLVALLSVKFVRNILRQLGGDPHYATEVVQAITKGNLDYEIEATGSDSLLASLAAMQQKLKENDRLKSDFVTRASHEFRTPLTAINGALSLAVSGQLGALPTPAMKVLDIAQKNSVRLAELINDLLDIDRLSIGKLELDLQIQPLMPIVDDACLSMTSYAHKYGVQLVVGPRYEYILVKVDARRLRQILVNFISNAAKFSPKGETITINVHTSFDKVKIDVIDHGCGIPESRHSTLFQPLSPEDKAAQNSAGGGGMGLAIAKELVELMNGTIGFVSTEGVGSCFYVELPLEEANSD